MSPVINLSAQEHGAQLQSGDGGLKTVIDVYSGQFGSRVSIFASKNDLFGTVLLHAQKQDPDIKYKLVSFCQSQQEIAMMYWACKQLVICSFSVSSRKTIFDEDTSLYWHSVSSGFNVFQLRRKTPVLKVLKLHQLFSNSDWCLVLGRSSTLCFCAVYVIIEMRLAPYCFIFLCRLLWGVGVTLYIVVLMMAKMAFYQSHSGDCTCSTSSCSSISAFM